MNDVLIQPKQKIRFLLIHKIVLGFWVFGFWEWTPSMGRKVGIPRGILPHVQTGLANWNPDNGLSLPGLTNWNPDNCLGKGGILQPVLS